MLIDSGFVTSSLRISGSFTQTGNAVITGSLTATQGITGSLFGTASWANNVISASYALNASNATSASFSTNAANATSASIAANAVTASRALNANTASFATSAATATSASFATSAASATSASFATSAASATSASFATNAANATSASIATNAVTASRALNANTASYVQLAASASYALTASHALNAGGGAAASNLIFSGTVSASVDVTSTQIFRLTSGSSTFMQVNNSGNVGIGTTSPITKLQINTSAYTGAGPGDSIRVSNNGSAWISADYSGSLAYFGASTPTIAKFAGYNYRTNTNIDVVLGQESMYIKADGNVGIGTTNPGYQLHISGSIGFASGSTNSLFAVRSGLYYNIYEPAGNVAIYLGNASDPGNYYDNTTHYFRSRGGGTTYAIINSSGNVGIGTTSPSAKLEVNVTRTSSTNATVLILSDNVTGVQTNGVYKSIRSISNNGSSVSEIRFLETDGTNNNTSIAFATAPSAGGLTERVRINQDGNVGIGTTTPTVRLDVSGSGKFTVGVNGTVDITDSGTITLRNQIGAEGRFGTFSNHDLVLTTNNTSRVTITSGGNVGIGTTTPTNTLQIVGTTATDHSITDITGAYRIFKPRGGTYVTQTSGVTGSIKIVYPVGFTNTMHTVKATVYEYTTQESFTVTFGGYNYSPDQSWYNVFAQIEGDAAVDRNFPVRFGFSGSNCVAYIGNLNSTWEYPQVFIEEVNLGYSGFAAGWTGSWAIAFETAAFRSASVAGLATVANTNAHNFARNGTSTYYSIGSVGIGTTTPASLLHVNGNISSSTLYINSSLGSYFVGDAGGTTFTGGTGYFYFNQSGPLYVQPTLIVRTGIQNDTATFLTLNGGTSNHTYVNGNIGVGITSPAARLHISGASNSMLRIESQDNSDTTPTVYIEGNKSKGPPGLATSVEIRSDVDFRGRGITLSVSESNARWFAGVPYQGSGYSIGYDATANRLPHYYQSSSLFITSNRTVGINTTAPTRRLSVYDTQVYMSLIASSYRTYSIGSDAYGFVVYDDTSAAYRLSISGSNGNVGIGTISPGHKLDVQGGRMRIIDTTNSPGTWLVGTGADDVFVGLQGNTSTSAFGIYSGGSWRFTMLNGGNVGIGTTSPAGQLEVTRPSSGFHLILNSSHPNSSSFTQYRINGSGGWEHGMAGLADSYKYYFSYGAIGAANAKVTFQNDGNVGIGTTSPGFILDVNGRMRLRYDGASTPGIWYNDLSNNQTFFSGIITSTSWGIWDGFEWIAEFNQTSNNFISKGDVVAFGSPSDITLKNIKEKVSSPIEAISKLNGYKFDWKPSDSIFQMKEDIGVIAQEVEKVFPELVRENEKTGIKSVRYQGLIPVLIEAVKEQQKQIDELKYLLQNK